MKVIKRVVGLDDSMIQFQVEAADVGKVFTVKAIFLRYSGGGGLPHGIEIKEDKDGDR